MVKGLAAGPAGLLAAVALLSAGAPADASHGALVGGVVVESARLEGTGTPGQARGCMLLGSVENGSGQRVVVRATYRARDPQGAPLTASARLPSLEPGERRAFASSVFARGDGSVEPCAGVRDVQLEATASPAP